MKKGGKMNARRPDAYDIALYFLFRAKELGAGDTISNLKMQKMLYYAQGHYLALFDEPLFNDEIQAWRYGPVVKKVYDKFSLYKDLSIDFKELENYDNKVYNEQHLDFLPFIFNKYNSFSAWELAHKTHSEEPYLKNFSHYNTNEIPQEQIKAFFKKELSKKNKEYMR